jgi:threonine aldolase
MIDLRSDTVTKPTAEMRQAMCDALVGDDQYGEDPTVLALEARAAEMLGKEAAMFVPSGTMGNLASLLAHCGRGDEAILGDESHIFWFESGGPSALGGIPLFQVRTDRFGCFDLNQVEAAIRIERPGYPRTGVVCVENTNNRCSGVVLPIDYLHDLRSLARSRGVPVHMDGARIFNAAAALGVPAAVIAAEADSVQFCLSKGLGAPVGSLVVGTREFLAAARRQRKILGGAMRQSGVIAAAGLVALTTMVDRLPEDHRRARTLALGLSEIPGITIDLETVQSNIVVFKVPGQDQAEMLNLFRDRELLVTNYGARGLRMVTHHQVDDEGIAKALEVIRSVVTSKVEGGQRVVA